MKMLFSLCWILIIATLNCPSSANKVLEKYDQFINSTPTTFGLLTVTHVRDGDYSYFRKHLQKYTTMECPLITQVSVVWNNDITPQEANFTQDPKWKRNVYFQKTPYNSMDFRYLVPKQSKAQVYFMIDDDMVIQCDELIKGFAVWKSTAIGDIGPFVGYYPRGFSLNSQQSKIEYSGPEDGKYQFLTLVGAAWISRFYCQLYNTNNVQVINKVRQIVRKKNNCDDIGINFIASYFFPEIIPITIRGQITELRMPGSQSHTSTHFQYRNECIKQFINIFGFLPTKLALRSNEIYMKRQKSEITKFSTFLRKKQIIDKYISPITNTSSLLQNLVQQKSINFQQQLKNITDANKMEITLLQQQLQQISTKCDKVYEQNIKLKLQNKKVKQNIHQLQNKEPIIKYQLNFWVTILSLSLNSIIFVFLCYKIVCHYCSNDKNRQNRSVRAPQEDISQSE